MMPSSPALNADNSLPAAPHLHAVKETCPLCDQPLPPDRLEEMQARIISRERTLTATITSHLQVQFARERTEALDQARKESAVLLLREKEQAALREVAARAAGCQMAEAAAQERIAAMQLASKGAEAALQDKITKADQAKAEADAKVLAAELRERALRESHDARLAQRLQEQREALEQAKTDAVNAAKSAAYEEKLKLSSKVEDLQRAIDKKTAEELGDGAEVDLFEALKAEFAGDRIERINRGQPGADILHVVIHNGKECGTIIYDSKNHNAWRNEFVTQLGANQLAAKAEHAILSTRKFPSGMRHLHVQDGVMVVTPSRAVVLVQIVRQHMVKTSALRLSNEARSQKTDTLYRFITSERCGDLFCHIDSHAEDLLELQAKEMRAHEATWKRQGELIRSVQKARGELCNEIEIIIGTAAPHAEVANE